jgi:hypothetical protein
MKNGVAGDATVAAKTDQRGGRKQVGGSDAFAAGTSARARSAPAHPRFARAAVEAD